MDSCTTRKWLRGKPFNQKPLKYNRFGATDSAGELQAIIYLHRDNDTSGIHQLIHCQTKLLIHLSGVCWTFESRTLIGRWKAFNFRASVPLYSLQLAASKAPYEHALKCTTNRKTKLKISIINSSSFPKQSLKSYSNRNFWNVNQTQLT